MAKLKTLNDAKKRSEEANARGSAFVKVESGKSVRLRFLQEVSMDGKNYSEERGTAEMIAIHRNPAKNMFKNQAACSMDTEGQCWACEQIGSDNESYKWKAKNHLLVNVAVLEDGVSWVPKILDTTFFTSHVGSTIVDMAEEFGTITEHEFKYSKNGSGIATTYSLLPLGQAKEPKEFKDFEIKDMSQFKVVPYNEQKEFYLTDIDNKSPDKAAESW